MAEDMKVITRTIRCKVLALTNIQTARNMLANGKIIRRMEKDNFCYKPES